MVRSFRILSILSSLIFLTAGVASADTILSYSLSGPTSATFELPVNPTVLSSSVADGVFEVLPINLIINGVASSDHLAFFNAATGGGLEAFSCESCPLDINLLGPQLYSGTEGMPTMLSLNAVLVNDFDTGEPAGTLSASPVSTPEPSVAAMTVFGILTIGLAAGTFKGKFSAASH
jgi:hypothetical protein